MILVGALLALCGAIVLWLARPMHARGRDMLRRAGAVLLVAGLVISAIAAIVVAIESM